MGYHAYSTYDTVMHGGFIEIFISLILTAMFYFPGLIYSLNKINCGEDLTKSQKFYNDSENNAQDDVNTNSLI